MKILKPLIGVAAATLLCASLASANTDMSSCNANRDYCIRVTADPSVQVAHFNAQATINGKLEKSQLDWEFPLDGTYGVRIKNAKKTMHSLFFDITTVNGLSVMNYCRVAAKKHEVGFHEIRIEKDPESKYYICNIYM